MSANSNRSTFRNPPLGLVRLECREVPANIAIQVDGTISITGDAGNDYARVAYASTNQVVNGVTREITDTTKIDVTMAGDGGNVMSRQYSASDVTKIAFSGRGGADVFVNLTTKSATTSTSNGGTVGSSVLQGSPGNANTSDTNSVGVIVVGSTGTVQVDYLYCGAGYRGQLGLYSLTGMDQYAPGSAEYIKEASRRVLTNSTEGRMVINRYNAIDQAKFGTSLPWEGYLNSGGTYRGQQNFEFLAGEKLGAMLVPNGRFQDVFANPKVGGSTRPLFSVPAANPYAVTPQMLGQMGDITGAGSVFAFEDQRLDQGSDRDYNDLVFQITGARGTATNVSEVVNASRNFTTTKVGTELIQYATVRIAADTSVQGTFQGGKYVVGSDGKIGVDFLFDGGGFVGQVGVFSLQGMSQYDPQSPEFRKEAIRRVISSSTLGHQIIDDYRDAAKISATDPLMKSMNGGTYRGIRSYAMNAGDTIGFVLIPNGALWEAYANPKIGDIKSPLFSLTEANPISVNGSNQFADAEGTGNVLAFEDIRQDGTTKMASDRDFNDIVFRLYGATSAGTKPKLKDISALGKDWTNSEVGRSVRLDSWENWS